MGTGPDRLPPEHAPLDGAGTGYWYIHNAVDDHSHLAYSELLEDERKETAAEFWKRAHAFFNHAGITVRRVLTDNGACYRAHNFAHDLGTAIAHKRTRPYRPQTNGKAERYNRTMLDEWAYAGPYESEADRAARFPAFLHHYNHHRGHTALRCASPADRVHNLSGQYSKVSGPVRELWMRARAAIGYVEPARWCW